MTLAKMKRVFLVGPFDRREETLQFLQRMEVLHIEPVAKMSGNLEKRNAFLIQETKRIEQVYEGIGRFRKMVDKVPIDVQEDQMVFFCESKLADLQEAHNRKQSLQKLVSDLGVWGDFELDHFRILEQEGIFIQLFRMEGKGLPDFAELKDVFVEVVKKKPVIHFFTLHFGGPIEISHATQLRHPAMGLKKAQDEIKALQKREQELLHELAGSADKIELLKQQYLAISNESSYTAYLGTLYSEEHLFGLQGWVPEDLEECLLKEIETSGLPLQIHTRYPLEGEIPPILFKNNWFVRRIEPLLKLYGLPAYQSLDPSNFFAPFMILFFGICLGDAGYGLIFLLASTWIKKKWGHFAKDLPLVMKLCQAFSVSSILIGLITGSVFGYNFTNREWILVDLDMNIGNPMILFYISLGLGVIHLSLSYLLGMLQANSLYDLLQKIGLLMVLWGGALLISHSIWFSVSPSTVSLLFQYGGWGFLSMGVLLSFLFASNSKTLSVRIGMGFWNVYGLTGLIGDLLSYARLFGLGIATTAIGAVMNQLTGIVYRAAGPILGAFLAVLILILGHTFNLVLSILGSTVHSARLHFVESFKFFFHGGGIEYKPFKVERESMV